MITLIQQGLGLRPRSSEPCCQEDAQWLRHCHLVFCGHKKGTAFLRLMMQQVEPFIYLQVLGTRLDVTSQDKEVTMAFVSKM